MRRKHFACATHVCLGNERWMEGGRRRERVRERLKEGERVGSRMEFEGFDVDGGR